MITVVMSIYNEKLDWIKLAIESTLGQTYSDIEYIIIVDNDIDNEIIKYLVEIANKDSRCSVFYNEKNIGLAASLNKALKIAKGKYIARIDADDISVLNRFERQVDFLNSNGFDMVSTLKVNIDENGELISKDDYIYKDPNVSLHSSSNFINHPSVLVKKEVLDRLGGYRELSNSEDYDLWLRMVENGFKIGILNEHLIYYRIRATSASIYRGLEQFYIDKYIFNLYLERKITGQDSFSRLNMEDFLLKKDLSDIAKERFAKSKKFLSEANFFLKKKEIFPFLISFFRSIYYFPGLLLFILQRKLF